MKKFLLSILTLLMLGGNLAWSIDIEGTITIDATEAEKSHLSGIKLIVGIPTGGTDVSMLKEFNLSSASNYTYTSWFQDKITFAIGTDKLCAYPAYATLLSQDWVIVDEGGNELGNPMQTEKITANTTLNLTIKYKGGGGGDDDTKATLIGRVGDGTTNCLGGVSVSISAIGYSVQSTKYDPSKYDDKVGCSYGYEFTNLELGTYTLTYSKAGYETATQEVTISEAGETIAPAVTLTPKYTFYGSLTYTNTAGETAYATNATVTAYDGPGADANVLGTATSDGSADWSMTLTCQTGATVYFDATHPDIEVAERAAAQANSTNGISVTIVCTPKAPVVETVTLALSASPAEGGTVSQSGDGTYDKGTSVTATATPNEGYKFVAWQEDGTDVYTENIYTFDINANRTLTAVFEQLPPVVETVTLTLSASPAEGGSVSQSGDGTYDKGASVTATATPNEGYKFVAWQEDGTDVYTENIYTFDINANRTLTAVFEQLPPVVEKVTLALSAIPTEGGTVSQSGNGTYDKGTSVTATATPNAGYKFVAWQENGADVHTETVYTFTIEDDRELTALFEQLPPVVEEVTLTLEANNAEWGSVEGAGTYGEGTEVTVKATANQGYKFRAWTKGEEVVSTKAEYTFTLTENLTLTAVFVKEPAATATLMLEVNDEAMGTVSGAGRYEKGIGVTVKATPNKGYVFQAWKNGGETVSTEAEYTFALMEDITLMAVFAKGDANEDLELAAWDIYTDNGQIVLRSNTACRYEVYSLSGILVSYGRMDAGACNITVDRSGLYMVCRTSATGISVKKVVVR